MPNMGLLSPETGSFCIPTLLPPTPNPNPQLRERGQERKPFLSLADTQPQPASFSMMSPILEPRRSLSFTEASVPRGYDCHQETTYYCQEPFLESLLCARYRTMSQEEVSCWGGREWGRTKAGGSPQGGAALLPSLRQRVWQCLCVGLVGVAPEMEPGPGGR